MKIIAIVAVDENWAIGKNNDLLYNIPTDMRFFRESTTKQIIVYGYNTLKSFPKQQPLPNRTNIVLSTKEINIPNLMVAHNIQDLKKILSTMKYENKDVFICGGASIYQQLLPICDEAYVTKIKATTDDADVFFPNLDKMENWEIETDYVSTLDADSGLVVKFCTYINKNKELFL